MINFHLPWWMGHALAGERKKKLKRAWAVKCCLFQDCSVFSCLSQQDARILCWSLSCWWLLTLSHHYEETFLGFNRKAVMVLGMYQDGPEGHFTSFCFWHFLLIQKTHKTSRKFWVFSAAASVKKSLLQGLSGTVQLVRNHELHLQRIMDPANPQGWFLQLLGWLFNLAELTALGFHWWLFSGHCFSVGLLRLPISKLWQSNLPTSRL